MHEGELVDMELGPAVRFALFQGECAQLAVTLYGGLRYPTAGESFPGGPSFPRFSLPPTGETRSTPAAEVECGCPVCWENGWT